MCNIAIDASARRAEAIGRVDIVKITRRLKRMWVQRLSPITGQPERIMATV